MDLAIGTQVEVVYRNSMYDRRHRYAQYMHIPEFVTYTGAVFPRQKWQSPETLNLTTGMKDFAWRELQVRNIVTVKAGDLTFTPQMQASQDRVWEVHGSKGNVYTVTETAGKRTCTCVGFTFRSSCKHINEVK